MERPIFKPLGTPVEELDTPALVVDSDLLDQNLSTVHTFFQQSDARLRPLVSAHGCPALAHKQLAAGGTVGGIAVTTLGQAEVFVTHGFSDVLIANVLITPAKLRRLCALSRQATLTVAIDHPSHVSLLAEAAASQQTSLQVVIDVDTGANRCGIAPGAPALELAQAVDQAPHLTLLGLMTTATSAALQPLLDTRGELERAGLQMHTVSVGSSVTYEDIAELEGVTEVCTGTYALMDARHRQALPNLHSAARVLTTVTSRPEPDTAITDSGQKAVGVDLGLPTADDLPHAEVVGLSAEHCRLRLDEQTASRLNPGDKVWLTPWDMDTCVNLYDNLYVARQGKLDLVWPVAARGRYR
ncbi:MAG: alanine racemase [Candidatus Tectomicrobia bacterium]|nr:alanine racemase [Candidatus Tectomicrobia bacterium]